jgi:DNA-binding FadR family transcriptional regulator
MFAALAAVVAELLSGRTLHHLMPTRPLVAATGLHGDVAQAVAGGSPVAARTAMGDIVEQVRDATGPALPLSGVRH